MEEAVVNLLVHYKYALVVPLTFFMQMVVGPTGGFLARLGYLDLPLFYAVLVASAVLHDTLVYVIGYRWGEKFVRICGPYVSLTHERIEGIKRLFHNHHTPILLGSKMTNGFGLSTLVLFTAGMTRVPFWRYSALNFFGELVWSGLLVSIGYFFGELHLRIENVFGQVALFAMFGLVVLVGVGFGRYLRVRLMQKLSETQASQ